MKSVRPNTKANRPPLPEQGKRSGKASHRKGPAIHGVERRIGEMKSVDLEKRKIDRPARRERSRYTLFG